MNKYKTYKLRICFLSIATNLTCLIYFTTTGCWLGTINVEKGGINAKDHMEFEFDIFLYKCLKPDVNHHKQCMLKIRRNSFKIQQKKTGTQVHKIV